LENDNILKKECICPKKVYYVYHATLIIGDWGGKGKISYISTPNIGFQRRLKRDFKARYILTNTIPQKITTRQRRKQKT
jgi:hypothetical protein